MSGASSSRLQVTVSQRLSEDGMEETQPTQDHLCHAIKPLGVNLLSDEGNGQTGHRMTSCPCPFTGRSSLTH